MKLSQVVFVEAVRDIGSDQTVSAFYACESPTRANGYQYELEGTETGVIAKHPRHSTRRLIPWSNVRSVDLADEPKREHWKTKAKREAVGGPEAA